MLELLFELALDLLQEGLFHLIRKHVKSKFLRGVLYTVTVVFIVLLAIGIVIGIYYLGYSMLSAILDILTEWL